MLVLVPVSHFGDVLRLQVILYTLMSSDRYHSDSGLLLYLKTGNLHPVVASHMDRRGNGPAGKGEEAGHLRFGAIKTDFIDSDSHLNLTLNSAGRR